MKLKPNGLWTGVLLAKGDLRLHRYGGGPAVTVKRGTLLHAFQCTPDGDLVANVGEHSIGVGDLRRGPYPLFRGLKQLTALEVLAREAL